ALFSLTDGDDLEVTGSDTDELGMFHIRYTLTSQGHAVWGAELAVHFAADGSLVLLNGRIIPLKGPFGQPTVDADKPRGAAVQHAHDAHPEIDPTAMTTLAPKLWLYPTGGRDAQLAWRVQIDVEDAQSPMVLETFVDAMTGLVLSASDITNYVDGRGTGVF